MLLTTNFFMTQSQSSFIKFSSIYFFLSPKVSDYKPGVDEANKPQIICLYSSNNLEILLVILLVNAFVPPTFA